MEALVVQLGDAAGRRDYEYLADLLWIPVLKNPPPQRTAASLRTLLSTGPLQPVGVPSSSGSLADVLNEHVKLLASLSRGDPSTAWSHASAASSALLKSLTAESRAEVPLLKRLCANLYYLTLFAPEAGRREEAARLLSRAFTTALTDRAALVASKKWASIAIANLLFRLYFRLGTVRLCTNIVRAIDATAAVDFPPLDEFPRAERVTYGYYRARLAINHGDFRRAEEWPIGAVRICPDQFASQKRCISHCMADPLISSVGN